MQNVADDKSLIDKVYDLLLSEKQAKNFYDLANAILSSDLEGNERTEVLARLYTTINMDGRFLSVGQNFWGLKSWYPVEQHDEEVASKITPKRKRRNLEEDDFDEDFDDIDDDFDDLDDELDDLDYDDDSDDDDEEDDIVDFDEEEIIEEDDFDDTDDNDTEDDLDSDLDLDEDSDEDD